MGCKSEPNRALRRRRTTMERLTGLAIISSALGIALAAALGACSGGPRAREVPGPEARVSSLGAVPIDRYRTRLSFEIELANPGPTAFTVESWDCTLSSGGAAAAVSHNAASRKLGPGESAALPLEVVVDSRSLGGGLADPGGPAEAPYRADGLVLLRDPSGKRIEAAACREGSMPIFREPRLRIVRLGIERDILVTTNLELTVEAYNPNPFPVELKSFAYTFDGEGKPWAEGNSPGPFELGAKSTGCAVLAFEMNFADRERGLLDLVNKLQVVRYRLAGKAIVSADLGARVDLPLEFDEAGSCRVVR